MIYKEIKKIKDVGSCMFCKRGKVDESGTNLEYPYESVLVISSDCTSSFRICTKCLIELLGILKN